MCESLQLTTIVSRGQSSPYNFNLHLENNKFFFSSLSNWCNGLYCSTRQWDIARGVVDVSDCTGQPSKVNGMEIRSTNCFGFTVLLSMSNSHTEQGCQNTLLTINTHLGIELNLNLF